MGGTDLGQIQVSLAADGADAATRGNFERGKGIMITNDVSGVSGPQPVQPNRPVQAQKAYAAKAPAKTDAANISEEAPAAQMLDKLRSTPDIRQDKVNALKAEIEAGTFESPERIAGAVDKFFSSDELGAE